MDPPVCVCDEGGNYVISLLSGHIGGANELSQKIAETIGAKAVITTATDVNNLPAIDILAKRLDLQIENVNAIKYINSSLLEKNVVFTVDPYNYLKHYWEFYRNVTYKKALKDGLENVVYISEYKPDPCRSSWLFLRPRLLIVGIGLNSGTKADEIYSAIETVFNLYKLSLLSIKLISTVDIKANENGLLEISKKLGVKIQWIESKVLKDVVVPNPSKIVMEKIGIPSVAEASALVTSKMGRLIVPKIKIGNVTIAVAKERSLSWEQAQDLSCT